MNYFCITSWRTSTWSLCIHKTRQRFRLFFTWNHFDFFSFQTNTSQKEKLANLRAKYPDDKSIAGEREESEEYVGDRQEIVQSWVWLGVLEPVLGYVDQFLRRDVPAEHSGWTTDSGHVATDSCIHGAIPVVWAKHGWFVVWKKK